MATSRFATPGTFREELESILDVPTWATRYVIDTQPHFIPIDTAVFKKVFAGVKGVPSSLLNGIMGHMVTSANNAGLQQLKIVDGVIKVRSTSTIVDSSNISTYTPALVFNARNVPKGILVGSVGNSYDAYKRLSDGFFQKIVAEFQNINIDIGHTIIPLEEGSTTRLGVTPVQALIDEVRQKIEIEQSRGIRSPAFLDDVQKVLNNINSAQTSFMRKTHGDYGVEVDATLTKSFKKGLLSIRANIVIAQERRENQYKFGPEEKKFLAKIKSLITKIRFSRSMEEEVVKRTIDTIEGKETPPTTSKVKLNTIKVKIPIVKVIVSKPPKVTRFNNAARNLNTGRFTSVINLRNLLNFHLHDVVAANMGKGQPPSRILNLQTGRLATSTEVERVSITRQGEVLAFYNYMKNPYATFSEGGKQQYPRTRDPKLLISKSIRQIATTMGINRMRAILV